MKNNKIIKYMKLNNKKVASFAATLITIGALSGGANGAVTTSGAITGDSIFNFRAVSDNPTSTLIPFTVPGAGSAISTLESDLSILPGLLASLPVVEADGLLTATQGSGISQDFMVSTGQTISVDYIFYDTETAISYSDIAFAITMFDDGLGGGEVLLGSTVLGDSAIAGQNVTPVSFTSFVAPSAGNMRIIIGVVDDDDTSVPAGIASVPEPSSTLLLGLGALGLVVRRKRTT